MHKVPIHHVVCFIHIMDNVVLSLFRSYFKELSTTKLLVSQGKPFLFWMSLKSMFWKQHKTVHIANELKTHNTMLLISNTNFVKVPSCTVLHGR